MEEKVLGRTITMNKTRKRILFAGAYGIENAGDDLPLIVMCEELKKRAPNIEFEFHALSRHPNKWEEKQYGVKMIKNLEYDSRDEATGKWFKGLNFGDDKQDILRIRDEIKQSDLLVFGAGNFLIDITIDVFRGPVPLLAIYVFLAKLYHKPVMLYGISIGPLKTEWGKDLSRWIIENSDIVTVRDEQSKRELKNILVKPKRIYVLPDATIGVNPAKSKRVKDILKEEGILESNKKKIGIALRDLSVVLPPSSAEEALRQLANSLNKLKDDCEFIFIPQSTYKEDDDRITARKFVQRLDSDLKYYIINHRYDPREIVGLYAYCDATLSIRLHGAVFSAIAGTPVIAMNYLPKVEGFMKSIGMDRFLINVDHIREELLLELFQEVLKNKNNLSEKINKEMNIKRKLVSQYAELAISLLYGDQNETKEG